MHVASGRLQLRPDPEDLLDCPSCVTCPKPWAFNGSKGRLCSWWHHIMNERDERVSMAQCFHEAGLINEKQKHIWGTGKAVL